ncbi:urease accessory protein [Gracilibacillus halophilus YIM-C55.5]|uniref:Urease accessory protein n=1 Tax=Gracilibacillus halophilus YIM-C55.5 TaxID=1308866 RepID=N4W987_9BACI|nr:urease accessory protein UreD [Gracilibacillus halophilus]ENH96848.1 urease accessory protein [Gracilibacillus halophilus YIM-C55.5]
MTERTIKARFQKVNVHDYEDEAPLKLQKTDKSHRVFSNYQISGLEDHEQSNRADLLVKKGTNIVVGPEDVLQLQPEQSHQLDMFVEVEEEALLIWNKQEIIPAKGSQYQQTSKIQLHQDAELIWGEIYHFDHDTFTSLSSSMEIWVDEECLVFDPFQFFPKSEVNHHYGMTETFPYVASMWYITPHPPFDEWDVQQRLSQAKHHRAGMTDLDGQGILIRWLSTDLSLLRKEMDDVFQFFDQQITDIRKWRI